MRRFQTEWETDWNALMCRPSQHIWDTQYVEVGQNHGHAFTRIKCIECNLELYLQTMAGDELERCGFCGGPNGIAPCANGEGWCELDPNPENPYNDPRRHDFPNAKHVSANMSAETFRADHCRQCGRKEGPYSDTHLICCKRCYELSCQHCLTETDCAWCHVKVRR